MKCLLSVCLTMLAGVAIVAASRTGQTPALQKGISVQMATSSHAAAVPEADRENAWIVTVTADGKIYFGTEPVTPDGLAEQMKTRPRNRAARLYLKADAGAPFSEVRQALRAAREDLFDDVVLLTAQSESAQPGTIALPEGFDVWIGNEATSSSVTVQLGSEQGAASLKLNNKAVASSDLQGRLAQIFDGRGARVVVLKASGQVPYAQVIQAIDDARAAGASRITMILPEI